MKYFTRKRSVPAKSPKRRAEVEDTSQTHKDEPECSKAATSKCQRDKLKDPYRLQRSGCKKNKKAAQLNEQGQQEASQHEGGDVQVQHVGTLVHVPSVDKKDLIQREENQATRHMHHQSQQMPSTSQLLDEHRQDRQTSTTSFGILARRVSGRQCRVAVAECLAAPPLHRGNSVEEVSGSVLQESAATNTGIHTTGESTELPPGAESRTPSDAASEGPSEEPEGIKHWHRSMLAKLNGARRRRDVRLSRKEVLNLQLVMEAVLKQHLALTREVECVKANLQSESVEPLSLGRALARLQLERQEEAANFARILATREEELREARPLKDQVEALSSACKEKDEDLERAATAMVTLRAMHQKETEEWRSRLREVLEQHTQQVRAFSGALEEKDLNTQEQVKKVNDTVAQHECVIADLAAGLKDQREKVTEYEKALEDRTRQVKELTSNAERMQNELQAQEETLIAALEEKDTVINELSHNLARIESQREIESLSLSRALTDKEVHIGELMKKIERLASDLRDKERALETYRSRMDTVNHELESTRLLVDGSRGDYETSMLVMSKAICVRDESADALQETVDTMRREHEEYQQTLDQLKSQKDIFNKKLDEKDTAIREHILEKQRLSADLAERDAQVNFFTTQQRMLTDAIGRKQNENDALLKTIEAMNEQQEKNARCLRQSFAELEQVKHELAKKASEVNRLENAIESQHTAHVTEMNVIRKSLEEERAKRDLEAHHFRSALHEKDVQIRELQDSFQDFQKEQEEKEKSLKDRLREKETEGKRLAKKMENFRAKTEAEYEETLKAKETTIQELTSELGLLEEARKQISLLEQGKGELEYQKDAQDKEIDQKLEEIKVLKNTVSQMKTAHQNRVASIKAETDKKLSEINELKTAIKTLKAGKEDKSKETDTLRKTLEKEKSSHRQALKQKEEEIKSLTVALNNVNAEHQARDQEMKKVLKSAETQRSQNESDIKRLKIMLADRENALKNLSGEIKNRDVESAKVKSELEYINEQVRSYITIIEERNSEIHSLKERLNSARNEKGVFEQKLKENERAQSADLQRLKDERANLETALKGENERANVIQTILKSKETEIDELTGINKEFHLKQKSMNHNFNRLLRVIKMSTTKREAERRALEEKLQRTESCLNELDTVSARFLAQNEDLQKQIASKEVEIKQLRANMTSCANEIKSIQEEADNQRKEREENDHAIQGLSQQLKDREEERDTLVNELDSMRDDFSMLKRESEARAGRIEELKREYEDRGCRIEELKREYEDRGCRIEELSQQLKSAEQDKESLSLEVSVIMGQNKRLGEENKAKFELMTHTIENARKEMDSEITVLKDNIQRLEEEAAYHAREMTSKEAQSCAKILSLEARLASKDEEIEKMIDVEQSERKKLKQLVDSEEDLQKNMEYLKQNQEHERAEFTQTIAEKDREVAELREKIKGMKHSFEESEKSVHSLLEESHSTKLEKDQTIKSLKSRLDELVNVKRQLEDKLLEGAKLSQQVLELENQINTQREISEKFRIEAEKSKQSEADALRSWTAERVEMEREKNEESQHLLAVLQRMETESKDYKEKLATQENQQKAFVQLMNSELNAMQLLECQARENLEALECQKEENKVLRSTLENLKKTTEEQGFELDSLRCGAESRGEELEKEKEVIRNALAKKDAELKVLHSTLDSLKSELRSRRAAEEARTCKVKDSLLREIDALKASSEQEKSTLTLLVEEKEKEVKKLSQTVNTLRADLDIQKRLLLAIPEGRAYFGVRSGHDGLLKPDSAKGLRNTKEQTVLSQDGDHSSLPGGMLLDEDIKHLLYPSNKKMQRIQILSKGEPERGSALKRTASEGDHLDIADLLDLSDFSFNSFQTPSSITLSNRTASEATTSSSPGSLIQYN